MASFDYTAACVPVGDDVAEAHRETWRRVAAAGAWWTGAERVAIAAEVRAAESCAVCRARKSTPMPDSRASHEAVERLSAAAVEAVHRIVTDASRLSSSWVEKLAADGVSDGHYVELLGLVVAVLSIDDFHRGLGLPLEALPEPRAGEPSRERPEGARRDTAWVPMLPLRAARRAAPDLFGDLPMVPNVIGAMSLVPDAVRDLKRLASVHYLRDLDVANPRARGEVLDRAQMELVAARVSALNECFY